MNIPNCDTHVCLAQLNIPNCDTRVSGSGLKSGPAPVNCDLTINQSPAAADATLPDNQFYATDKTGK